MRRADGFTLLEILTVLVIIALVAGLSLPQLRRIAESVESAGQRRGLQTAIEGLGYQAYVTARPLSLESAKGGVDGAALNGAELWIPPGWQLRVAAPIRYSSNGVCSGGRMTIVDPRGVSEPFVLKPPRCLLELGQEAE